MKKIQVGILFLSIIGSLVFLPSANGTDNSNLNVTINGLKNQKGKVCFNLFSSSRGFPSNKKLALQSKCINIKETPLQLNFKSLKAGTYALSIYHDANTDNKFNRNALGMPVEGFAFSRNPQVLTSAPDFGDSAIFVAGENMNIEVNMNYLMGS
ncbi:MAG: DUF2141 domain-containing protein [Cyanobacteria bacterium P01_D01_bin.50]